MVFFFPWLLAVVTLSRSIEVECWFCSWYCEWDWELADRWLRVSNLDDGKTGDLRAMSGRIFKIVILIINWRAVARLYAEIALCLFYTYRYRGIVWRHVLSVFLFTSLSGSSPYSKNLSHTFIHLIWLHRCIQRETVSYIPPDLRTQGHLWG